MKKLNVLILSLISILNLSAAEVVQIPPDFRFGAATGIYFVIYLRTLNLNISSRLSNRGRMEQGRKNSEHLGHDDSRSTWQHF